MKIEDFDFATKQISNSHVECILINRESKIKFGAIIQANGMPPNEWVFSKFLEDKRMNHFFIDIEGQIVHNEVIVDKKETVISEELKNFEKS
jgi:hypothetical protein